MTEINKNFHSRTHIRIDSVRDVQKFVSLINSDGTSDKLIIENFDRSFSTSARSRLGVLYAMAYYNEETFLVNLDRDGIYPPGIDAFRI